MRIRCVLGRTLQTLAILLIPAVALSAPPSGFIVDSIARPDGNSWGSIVGLTFADDGSMFVYERNGTIWLVDENNQTPDPGAQPVLDISDEVGGWRDFGLLGVTLDPNFLSNGRIYLLYVVDRHHLLNCSEPASGSGSPLCNGNYNPNTNEYFNATIGRVTRYTMDVNNGFATDYASRKVLIGESIDKGIPILHQSHGTGQLVFGTDGTLIGSTGDGASYSSTDTGSAGETYYAQALADGIIRQAENVGAYRSQMLTSFNGKLFRIDPETGDGLPSNPYYEPSDPRAVKSRVWALGLRNPFRITHRPGTGDHEPSAGNPGTIYIGDVGWGTWEDLHVSVYGGENFGWPYFEGMTQHNGYSSRNTPNMDAPNPLFGVNGCTQEYFYFRELIKQDTLNAVSFTNSCDGSAIPAQVNTYIHTRPTIDWRHGSSPNARWSTYDAGGNAEQPQIGATSSLGLTVDGSPFSGNAAVGGVWYTGDDFPPEYQNSYFHADYARRWIQNVVLDEADQPVSLAMFDTSPGPVVSLATHPIEGRLYYVVWGQAVRRVSYAPNGNFIPEAVASVSPGFGPSPLSVQFTGDQSNDLDGSIVAWLWDFKDGTTSTDANPQHTFVASSSNPETFNVSLTVTDDGGATDSTNVVVSSNNTPPSVTITSPPQGTEYPLGGDTVYALEANISDAEHSQGQLSCEWNTVLHHNTHTHDEPPSFLCSSSTVISGLGCGEETYYFVVSLTVTDNSGLSTTDSVTLLPDCDGGGSNTPPMASFTATPGSGEAPLAVVFDAGGSIDPDGTITNYAWDFGDGNSGNGQTTSHTYTNAGSYSATLTVTDDGGLTAQSLATITVTAPPNNDWWDTNWSTRRTLTFDNSGIGENLVDFPVLVRLTPSDVDYGLMRPNGEDLRFIDADGITVLPHEISSWNPGGESTVWVKVPQVDANSTGDFVMLYYGNALAADGQNAAAVWSDYAGVWHLDGDENDATANANHGINLGTATVAGFAGAARQFDGASYIDAGNSPSLGITGAITIAAWVDVNAGGGSPRIVSKKTTWRASAGYNLEYKPTADHLTVLGSGSDPGLAEGVTLGGGWQYVVATIDGSTPRLFVDGVDVSSGDTSVSALAADSTPFNIGRRAGGGDYFVGLIDELRIAPTARSGDWIQAQYRSMANSFVTISSDNGGGNNSPSVVLTQPVTGATFIAPADITVNADAADADGTIDRVDFYADGTLIGTDSSSPYSITWGNVSAGSYSVTAQAFDNEGASNTSAAASIDVYAAPSITLTSPADGATVNTFDVPFSYTLSGDPASYDHIHFTLDSNPQHVTVRDLSGTYVYEDIPNGAHTMTVQLMDEQHSPVSATDSVSFTVAVTVANQAPVVSAGPDLTATTGVELAISGSVSDDGLPNPPAAVSVQWTAQAGPATPTWPQNDADAAQTHVVFPQAGSYVLRLTGDDSDLSSFDEVVVTVSDLPNELPIASFTASPSAGQAPLAVAFDASGSIDPDGTITSYAWDFGDGGSAAGSTANHIFSSTGSYTVTLTVTDDAGATATRTTVITATADWWDTNWSTRRTLSFDNSGIGENLVDFPVLVRLTPSDVDYGLMRPNGEDLRFIDADGITVLPHEIGTWNPGGESTVWVKVPQVDANSTGDFVMLYYGNALAADGQNAAAVWSDYAGVWHLDGDENDATANANHGINLGTATVAGFAGAARQFDGASYIDAGNSPSLGITGAITIAAWVDVNAGGGSPRIVSKKTTWRASAGYNLEYKPTADHLTVLGSGSDPGLAEGVTLGGGWQYVVATIDGSTPRLFVDGVDVSSGDTSVSALAADSTPFNIGRRAGGGDYFVGLIDELRIAPTARSGDWIQAQYRSMANSFVTISSDNGGGNNSPSVVLTQPVTGATFIAPADITVNADAADADGTIDRVDFYADGTLIGTDSSSPYSITWGNVSAGSYSVTAQAFDNEGASNTSAAASIDVYAAPSITLTSPADGATVDTFDVPFSYTLSGDPASYDHIHFTLDSNPQHVTVRDLSGTYVYEDIPNGAHTMTVQLMDEQHSPVSATDSVSFTVAVTVANQAPVVSAGPDLTATTGVELAISGSVSDDGLPNPPAAVSVQWTAQAGPATPTWPQNDADAAQTHVVFPQAGSYVLRLTGDDSDLSSFDEVVVTVSDLPNELPIASFTASPSAGQAPLAVAFDASGSIDPDGTITSYAWDFGDGGSAAGSTANHIFSSTGSYTVTLTVTDDAGATATRTTVITATADWWDTNWSTRRTLSFDNSGIGENLVDFPVLVRLTPSDVDYGLMRPNGEDLRFIDADGITVLPHEIGTWNPAGESTVWVKVPQVDANSTGDFVMLYYGNALAADGQNAAAVWSDYAGVWHLDGDENDATANANHGINLGTATVAGFAGAARQFDGASYIDAGNSPSLGITGAITIAAWVDVNAGGGSPRIVSKKTTWRASAGYNLEYKPTADHLTVLGSGSDPGLAEGVTLGGGWQYVVATIDGSTPRLFVDGVDVSSGDTSVSALAADSTPFNIGRRAGGGDYFVGLIDELRIAPTARSGDWIQAQYRSMANSFVTISE